MESKQCGKCKKIKPLPLFNKDSEKKDGYSYRCRDCNKARLKEWYKTHKEVMSIWRKNNPERVKEINKKYAKKKRSMLNGKLNSIMGSNISTSLRGYKRGRSWERLVGYTLEDLKKHLSNNFKKEMSWDNYGSYWHIDHKIPIAAFNFLSPSDHDFKVCWGLKNLCPLEKTANMVKGATLEHPFQPSLLI